MPQITVISCPNPQEPPQPKPGYYAILPAGVRYDRRLKPAEKILFAEITALSEARGYCFASNQYFEHLFEVSRSTVKLWITELQALGYVKVEVTTDPAGRVLERKIIPSEALSAHPGQKIDLPPVKKLTQGGSKNRPYNTTRENTTRVSSSEEPTGMTALFEKTEKAFGQLTTYQKAKLAEAVGELGETLVSEILTSCLTNGARKYAYLQKALDKARSQGVTTVEQYRGSHGRETGQIVDRPTPSGNDLFRRAIGRPFRSKRQE